MKYKYRACDHLTTVSLPSSLKTLWAAFQGCDMLNCVIMNRDTPLEISNGTFNDLESVLTLYVPAGCKAAYQAADNWKTFKDIVEINSITVGSTGYATFCSPKAMDFTDVEGIKAYIASGFNPETGTLVLTRVTEVPAGEGLYIVGTPGTYIVPETTTAMMYSNLLKGVTTLQLSPQQMATIPTSFWQMVVMALASTPCRQPER